MTTYLLPQYHHRRNLHLYNFFHRYIPQLVWLQRLALSLQPLLPLNQRLPKLRRLSHLRNPRGLRNLSALRSVRNRYAAANSAQCVYAGGLGEDGEEPKSGTGMAQDRIEFWF